MTKRLEFKNCRTQPERESLFAAWLLRLSEQSLFNFERSLRTHAAADGLDEVEIERGLIQAREINASAVAEALRQFREYLNAR